LTSGENTGLQNGNKVFSTYCASCHSYTKKLIGPPLAGIKQELQLDAYSWLDIYLKDSKRLLKSGDERSRRVYNEYKEYAQWNHTDSLYTAEDKKDLIGFILLLKE